MKILVLDDNAARHARFSGYLKQHLVIHAWNFQDAIDALQNFGPFDVVYLDRDLNDFGLHSYEEDAVGDFRELSGEDVALHIAHKLSFGKLPGEVVVHSHNPFRAPALIRILEAASIPVSYRPYIDGPYITPDVTDTPVVGDAEMAEDDRWDPIPESAWHSFGEGK